MVKRILIAGLILGIPSLLLGLTAFQPTDEMRKLGLSERSTQGLIWDSLRNGYLSLPSRDALRKIPVSERAGIVRWAGGFARTFTQSDTFKKLYAEYRESMKPTAPEAPTPMAEQVKAQKEDMQKSIREMEASIKSMPADQQAAMKPVLEMMRQQVKELDNPDNPMLSKEMEGMMQRSHAEDLLQHKEKLTEWEKGYPPTPDKMIQQRLAEFLEASKNVDFTAEVVPGRGGKMVFARPDYERKPESWKLCFRAGKETVEAAREFASAWLAEFAKK
jgi:hypothetical protein